MGESSWSITHDFAFAVGGAERVTAALANEVLPQARVLALGADEKILSALNIERTDVVFPWMRASFYRQLTPLYVALLSQLAPIAGNLLCSSYAFSHHLRCEGAKVVYCHSPLRQAWSGSKLYGNQHGKLARSAYSILGSLLRKADLRASVQAHAFIASSEAVKFRIEKYYRRSPVAVIHPPLCESFRPRHVSGEGYYVWAGRIVEPYKNLSMVLESFRGTDRQLLVAGDGRDRAKLEANAPPNVVFLGAVSGDELARLFSASRAVIFSSEDDFGLIPVEAMACGAPVVAYAAGGALETVKEAETGVFYSEQTVEKLRAALNRVEILHFDRVRISSYAVARFSLMRFKSEIQDVLASVSPEDGLAK